MNVRHMVGLALVLNFSLSLGVKAQETVSWQEQPDFSGAWTDSTTGRQIVIDQDSSAFEIVDKRNSSQLHHTFSLDGAESRNTTPHEAWVSRAKWVGSAIVITTTSTWSNGDVRELMHVYAFQSDGVLAVTRIDNDTLGEHYIMPVRTDIFEQEFQSAE